MDKKRGDVSSFDYNAQKVEVDESLLSVVARISQYLPPEQVKTRFTSEAPETGGVRKFPYFRVDSKLIVCRGNLLMINDNRPTAAQKEECYKRASNNAMETILWVEVGFGGLEKLAAHPASKNWTSGVGHFVGDEQRAKEIMTAGKEMYHSTLNNFVGFRTARGITDDCFTKFKLEPLLEKWK